MIKDVLKALLSDEPKIVSFETQLETLRQCGIMPKEQVTEEVIISELEKLGFAKEDTENDPSLLLVVLGGSREVEEGVFEPNSDDVLYFNTECVFESGVYREVLSHLSTMAMGNLELEDIEENIDLENYEASISFTYKAQLYKWDLRVVDDNFDMNLLTNINNMLAADNCGKSFYMQCEEETVIIIFTDKKTAKNLNKNLNLGFELA